MVLFLAVLLSIIQAQALPSTITIHARQPNNQH